MPCLCQYFSKDKRLMSSRSEGLLEASSEKSISGSDDTCSVKLVEIGEISATQLSSLNAEIWSLRSNLSENEIVAESMQAVVKSLVEDKYSLIEQLCEAKDLHEHFCQQYAEERENHVLERKELINEVFCLKVALDEKIDLLHKTVKQNIELKVKLRDAHELINLMGIMYLKLRASTGNICNDNEKNKQQLEKINKNNKI